jgi:hypothetical protein
MYAPCWSSTESAALTPMLAQRRTPHNENAMFYVASAPCHSVTTINEPRRSRPAQCACVEGIRRSTAICESAREPRIVEPQIGKDVAGTLLERLAVLLSLHLSAICQSRVLESSVRAVLRMFDSCTRMSRSKHFVRNVHRTVGELIHDT